MKKIIMYFAILVMAITTFITTKKVNTSGNVDLASLTSINTANAECNMTGGGGSGVCRLSWDYQYVCYAGDGNPGNWNCWVLG